MKRGAYSKPPAKARPKTLGERIRRIRLSRKWTQGDLAEALGLDQQAVSAWERDRAMPSGPSLEALCRLFGIAPEALLTGKGFSVPDHPGGEGPVDPMAVRPTVVHLLPAMPEQILAMDLAEGTTRPLDLKEAVKALQAAAKAGKQVWLVTK